MPPLDSLRPPRVTQPMSEDRKAAFLKALSETGVFSHSARVASPRARGSCEQTFRDLCLKDEDFARRVEEARDQARSAIVIEVRRRALEGVEEPVVSGGRIVTTIRRYSDRLLEILARTIPDLRPDPPTPAKQTMPLDQAKAEWWCLPMETRIEVLRENHLERLIPRAHEEHFPGEE